MIEVPPPERRRVDGRVLGLAMQVGRGRIVVLGNSAMISAQVAFIPGRPVLDLGAQSLENLQNSKTTEKKPIGMSYPGADNRQFVLNVMHWLSGLLN